MIEKNKIISVTDWSEVKKNLPNGIVCDNSMKNLGLHFYGEKIWTSGYVGVVRLKDSNGNVLKDNQGKDCILQVNSRFNLDPWTMFDKVLSDDEFPEYCKDKNGITDKNKFFEIFTDEKPIEIETDDNGGDLLLAISFIKLCKEICQKQLKAKMSFSEENLVGKIKGKIVFSKQIKKNISTGRADRIYCKYSQFTVDTLENRILKSAILKAQKIIQGKNLPSIHSMLVFCKTSLENVRTVNITSADIARAKTNGFYAYYKPAVALAQLLILKSSINLNLEHTVKKSKRVIPYAIKMEALFEFYCRSIIKDKIKDKDNITLLPYKEQIDLLCNKEHNENNYLMNSCIPDIVLYNESKICVLDAKYKNIETKKSSRADSHQLLSYTLLLNAKVCGFIFPSNNKKENSLDNIISLFDNQENGANYISSYGVNNDNKKLQKESSGIIYREFYLYYNPNETK